MSKTMVEIIHEHASHGLRDGKHVCHAKGCATVYPGDAYPEAIVVTAHVVGQLIEAGYGSKHDAWATGYAAGERSESWRTDNPHPKTR